MVMIARETADMTRVVIPSCRGPRLGKYHNEKRVAHYLLGYSTLRKRWRLRAC